MERPDEDGAAAVEMALVLPLLVLLVFGIIVFGIHLFRLQSMEAAVREGGRLAAIGATAAEIEGRILDEQRIVAAATELTVTITKTVAGLTVTTTTPPCTSGDAAVGARVDITAAVADPAAYGMTIPFVSGAIAPDFESSASFRCEN